MSPTGGAPNTPPNGPPPSAIQSIAPKVAFQTNNVPPSQFVYMRDGEVLNLNLLSNVTGMVVNFRMRYLTPQNEIKETTFTTPGLTGNLPQIFQVPVAEGWIISFAFQALGGLPSGSWGFAQVLLGRAQTATLLSQMYGIIWQGYIPINTANGWPGTPAKEISDGAGTLRSIVGSVPAAGADIFETVPNSRRWTLLALRASLTTSATVANRNPQLQLLDGAGNIFYRGYSNFNLAASSLAAFSAALLGSTADRLVGDIQTCLLLPIPLKQAFRIQTITSNLQAADQWTAPNYLVQEWGLWDN